MKKGLLISKRRLFIYLGIEIVLSWVIILNLIEAPHEYAFSYLLLYGFFLILPAVLIFKRKIDIFEPIYLFTLMYFTMGISGLYILFKRFESNQILGSNELVDIQLFNLSFALAEVGFICFLLGYYLFINKSTVPNISSNFQYQQKISNFWIKFFIIIYLSIGIINFMYVSLTISGNPLTYIIELGRQGTGEDSLLREYNVTNLGYHFLYSAIFLWLFLLLKKSQDKPWCKLLFIVFFIFSILVQLSSARISGTIAFIITVIVLYRYYSRKVSLYSPLYSYGIISFVILGIVLYLLRYISKIYFYYYLLGNSDKFWESFYELFTWEYLGFLAVEKGNVANIQVVMTILNNWEESVGFLYGSSFLSWLTRFMPSSLNMPDLSIATKLKETWYLHSQSGGLPPTCIGEMYANFGVLGVIIGMFLTGIIFAFLYNLMIKHRNYWITLIYASILTKFIFLYPKGELANFSGSLWLFLPTIVTVTIIKLISR